MTIRRFGAFVLLSTSLCLLAFRPAFAATVNCPTGAGADYASITAALAADESLIEFRGTCVENVILPSETQLVGDDSTAVLDGFITIRLGAAIVTLGSFRMIADHDILVAFASFADIFRVTVDRGLLEVRNSSGVVLEDVSITSPADDQAIRVQRGSTIELFDGNTITGTSTFTPAITVNNGSNLVSSGDSTIVGSPVALQVDIGSSASVLNGVLTGTVLTENQSTLVFRPAASVVGNIEVRRDSALINDSISDGDVSVSGNVTCTDAESSVSGGFSVAGVNTCTGFGGPPSAPPGMGMGMGMGMGP